MTKTLALWTGALAALAAAGPVAAHHSGYVYETTPISVKGALVRFEHVNPHTVMTLEDRSEDGQVRRWAVEGPSQAELDRSGIGADLPKVGDIVQFCAFPYRSAAEIARDPRIRPPADPSARPRSQAPDGSSPRFVAGHVMLTPDGTKRLWEPHGLISECIRISDDPRQSWVDFLDENARARQALCEQQGRSNVQSNASLRDLIAEINRALAEPCE